MLVKNQQDPNGLKKHSSNFIPNPQNSTIKIQQISCHKLKRNVKAQTNHFHQHSKPLLRACNYKEVL